MIEIITAIVLWSHQGEYSIQHCQMVDRCDTYTLNVTKRVCERVIEEAYKNRPDLLFSCVTP